MPGLITALDTDLYFEVLQFYARQLQALDAGRLEQFVETFTDTAVFGHTPGRPPARGRAGIERDLRAAREFFASDPQQRRHMVTMVDLEPQADNTIRTTAYALVVTTRPGTGPEPVRTCVLHDVLVRNEGRLRTHIRTVDNDGS